MTVNLGLRRIASVSAFLVAMGIASASQAGIIPWAYDAVFGPVRYPARGHGYSPYAVSYARPVYVRSMPVSYGQPSGCSSCSTSDYAPVSYAAPSYGYGCGPIAVSACDPCGARSQAAVSGCSTAPATAAPAKAPVTNGKSAWSGTKKPIEPANNEVPAPRTFEDRTRGTTPAGGTSDEGFGAGTRTRGKPDADAADKDIEVNRPATNDDEPTLVKPKKTPAKTPEIDLEAAPEANPAAPAKPADDGFKQPIEKKTEGDLDLEDKAGTTIRQRQPSLNLDAKIAWGTAKRLERVPFHAKLAKASVARRVPATDSDWTPIVAKPSGPQLVRK